MQVPTSAELQRRGPAAFNALLSAVVSPERQSPSSIRKARRRPRTSLGAPEHGRTTTRSAWALACDDDSVEGHGDTVTDGGSRAPAGPMPGPGPGASASDSRLTLAADVDTDDDGVVEDGGDVRARAPTIGDIPDGDVAALAASSSILARLFDLHPEEGMMIAASLERRVFRTGQTILGQGERSDRVFFVSAGEVRARRTVVVGQGPRSPVRPASSMIPTGAGAEGGAGTDEEGRALSFLEFADATAQAGTAAPQPREVEDRIGEEHRSLRHRGLLERGRRALTERRTVDVSMLTAGSHFGDDALLDIGAERGTGRGGGGFSDDGDSDGSGATADGNSESDLDHGGEDPDEGGAAAAGGVDGNLPTIERGLSDVLDGHVHGSPTTAGALDASWASSEAWTAEGSDSRTVFESFRRRARAVVLADAAHRGSAPRGPRGPPARTSFRAASECVVFSMRATSFLAIVPRSVFRGVREFARKRVAYFGEVAGTADAAGSWRGRALGPPPVLTLGASRNLHVVVEDGKTVTRPASALKKKMKKKKNGVAGADTDAGTAEEDHISAGTGGTPPPGALERRFLERRGRRPQSAPVSRVPRAGPGGSPVRQSSVAVRLDMSGGEATEEEAHPSPTNPRDYAARAMDAFDAECEAVRMKVLQKHASERRLAEERRERTRRAEARAAVLEARYREMRAQGRGAGVAASRGDMSSGGAGVEDGRIDGVSSRGRATPSRRLRPQSAPLRGATPARDPWRISGVADVGTVMKPATPDPSGPREVPPSPSRAAASSESAGVRPPFRVRTGRGESASRPRTPALSKEAWRRCNESTLLRPDSRTADRVEAGDGAAASGHDTGPPRSLHQTPEPSERDLAWSSPTGKPTTAGDHRERVALAAQLSRRLQSKELRSRCMPSPQAVAAAAVTAAAADHDSPLRVSSVRVEEKVREPPRRWKGRIGGRVRRKTSRSRSRK